MHASVMLPRVGVNRGENTSSILDSISVWNPIGSDVVNARLRALTFRPDFGTKREKEPKQEENGCKADQDKHRQDQHTNLPGASHQLCRVQPST